jgi:hypothetical protein
VSVDNHNELPHASCGQVDMSDVTETILAEMQSAGWFLEASRERRYDRPTAWDINCGYCEEWAEEAARRYGGEVLDLVELGYDEDAYSHIILCLGDRYFDAQHPLGVDAHEDLDVVRGVDRKTFLGERRPPCVAMSM